MATREQVIQKIVAHLNGDLGEVELVRWAEDAFVAVSESDVTIPHENMLLDVLGYVGAGDTPGFPLTWSVLSEFLERLGAKVRVVVEG